MFLVRNLFSAYLLPYDSGFTRSRSVFQNALCVDPPEDVHDNSDRAGPPCLVAGAETCPIVAVEIFVEQDQVAPVRIFLELLRASVHRPPAVRVAKERGCQPALDLLRNLEQASCNGRNRSDTGP